MKKRKIFAIVFLIVANIITISLIIKGNKLIEKSENMYVPPMGNSGWFEASSKQSDYEFDGDFLKIAGIMGTIFVNIVGLVIFFMPDGKTIINHTMESINSINDKVVEMRKKHQDVHHTICQYCGTKFNDNSAKCPNCGAPNRK